MICIMAAANSQIPMLPISQKLSFIITVALFVFVCADGARTTQRQQEQQEAPIFSSDGGLIHTDHYGVGITLPLAPDVDGFFVVTVGFGTPTLDLDLLFDTGSDMSWVQCDSSSSSSSSSSTTTAFNPSLSSTSSDVSCGNNCNFSVGYRDGSQSSGVYANDTLSLAPTAVQQGFVFGCAENFTGNFGRTVGVLGLGQGYFSLLAQTDTTLFSIFCYCLPLADSSTGSLWFGVQAMETCLPGQPKMTPLVIQPNNNGLTNYFVKFTGITIGQQQLNFASLLPSSQMNTIIDSGTIVTRLPPAVYKELRAAFQGLMAGYVTAARTKLLDTCYNLEAHQNSWVPPEMVLHFEDSVDVKLDPSAVILKEGDENPMSRVCLALAANADDGDLTIIGSQQHRGFKVYYDIHGQKLGFGTAGCSTN